MKSPPTLILASNSPYRRELLERLKIPFECVASGVDETPAPDEAALSLVTRLARAKAQAVAAQQPDAWIIGSDQVAVLDQASSAERIFGKPGTVERCIAQLRACSGKTLCFVTAVAVVRNRDGAMYEFLDTTRVAFRVTEPASIERYVARETPLDCAGGFKSEALGITLCDSIDSTDPTALIGLPLIRLSVLLRNIGFDLP